MSSTENVEIPVRISTVEEALEHYRRQRHRGPISVGPINRILMPHSLLYRPDYITEDQLFKVLISKYEKMLSKMKKTLVAADNIDRMNFSDVLKNCDANIEEMYNIIDKIQNNATSQVYFMNQFHRWFDSLKIYKFLKAYDK